MVEVSNVEPMKVAHAQDLPDIRVRLNQLFYADGDSISVTVKHGRGFAEVDVLPIVLSAPHSQDVEILTLLPAGGGLYVTEKPVVVSAHSSPQTVKHHDGVLSLQPNEVFFAMYYLDPDRLGTDVECNVVVDQGFMEDESAAKQAPCQVEPELAMTDDERHIPTGGKRIGTVLRTDGLPVQLPVDELVIYPGRDSDLEDFLVESGGVIRRSNRLDGDPGPDVRQQSTMKRATHSHGLDPLKANPQPDPPASHLAGIDPLGAGPQPEPPTSYLVGIDTERVDLRHLPQMRTWFKEADTLYGSSEAVLRIYAAALYFQMRGYRVGVNPRLQFFGAPTITEQASGDVGANMTDRGDGFINVERTWAYTALSDADQRRINVAFLDMGFAPNPDFRTPAAGLFECDLEGASVVSGYLSGFECGRGVAEGPPTVGNSFFGSRSWHGNGSVTTAAGVGNNGFGGVGVGGQVAVPMLYRFGLASYAFEMGLGIKKATQDGASVINLSAGYPCRIIDNVGIEFNICSTAGRAAFCAAITAALALAAAVVCATASVVAAIPFVGPVLAVPLFIACGAALVVLTVATSACFATLVAGDLRGPLRDGIAFATRRGVPVVTIAGNRLQPASLPPVIREIIDLEEQRTERWQIIPAAIPETIVVGAVDPTTFENMHFFGSRVDLWAPQGTLYYAPPTTGALTSPALHVQQSPFGGSSCAAPYVTGVIALMQAVNPALDPANTALTDAARAAIPATVKAILTNTVFSNAVLTAAGIANPRGERGNLVNPLAAVQAAAINTAPQPLPDFDLLGYDRALNFDEVGATTSADTAATARPLTPGVPVTGTILTIRGEGGVANQHDADYFTFTMPVAPPGLYAAELTLRTPTMARFGTLEVVGGGLSVAPPVALSPVEEVRTVRTGELFPGATLTFAIQGRGDDDNLYRLELGTPAVVRPLPTADRFDADDPQVTPPESRPNNNDPARAAHLGTGQFPWVLVAENAIGEELYEIRIPDLNFHEPADVDWFEIVDLPPYPFFEGPGCRPELIIEFGPGILLTATTEDGVVLVQDRSSPVRIPADLVTVPLLFNLRPAVPGTFVEYDLRLTYNLPSYRICRLAERWGMIEELAGMRRELVFPGFLPDLEPFLAPVPFPRVPRQVDERGRIVDADHYVVPWFGDGPFELRASVPADQSLQLQLLAGDGEVIAQVGSPALSREVSEPRSKRTRHTLRIEIPSLPADDYVLAVSHALPGTRVDLELPTR